MLFKHFIRNINFNYNVPPRWCNVNVFVSYAVDHWFDLWSSQTKDYEVNIGCFATDHAALLIRNKSKGLLTRCIDKVSNWSDMSTCWLLFQWASKLNYKRVGLVQIRHHNALIQRNQFSPWYSWKIPSLVLNNNHSLT